MSNLHATHWQIYNTPEESFRINERWYNKYDTHKSIINKRRIDQRTWRRFYIKQINQLMQTSLNTKMAPSPRPSTNLQGNQIHMYGLDTAHRKVSNRHEDKFQYQWTLIRSMQTKRSTIKDANMINKTPKNNNWQIINHRNCYNW